MFTAYDPNGFLGRYPLNGTVLFRFLASGYPQVWLLLLAVAELLLRNVTKDESSC
jgi:hypothetical protein